MTTRAKAELFKWIVYVFVATAFLSLQNSPDFIRIGQVRPDFLLGFAIFLSVVEDAYKAAIFGSFLGLMMDFSQQSEVGFYGSIFMALCFLTSVLIHKYFKANFLNGFLFFLASLILIEIFSYIFNYFIWYEKAYVIFDMTYGGRILYTLAVSPVVYFIVGKLDDVLNRKR